MFNAIVKDVALEASGVGGNAYMSRRHVLTYMIQINQ